MTRAEELDGAEIERWWAALSEAWPAFGEHCAPTGERTVFVSEPIDPGADPRIG